VSLLPYLYADSGGDSAGFGTPKLCGMRTHAPVMDPSAFRMSPIRFNWRSLRHETLGPRVLAQDSCAFGVEAGSPAASSGTGSIRNSPLRSVEMMTRAGLWLGVHCCAPATFVGSNTITRPRFSRTLPTQM
jgi:hypothetical protein